MRPLDPLALPLSGTTLVEASAGSGKTHTITTLYVRLLLETPVQPGEILVVTYTNAATAELRTRVRRRLVQALAALEAGASEDADLDTMFRARLASRAADRQRLTAALYGFDEAAIFTIHGFCQRVLQQHAFESGTPFDLELIGDQTALRDEVVSDFWVRQLYAAPEEVVRDIVGELSPMSLASLVQRVVAQPDLAVLPQPGAHDPAKLRTQLAAIDFARRELPRRMGEAGVQSFDDLLLQLDAALGGPGGAALAAQVRRRFPVALIDEFQDTDPVQYRIFERLYGGRDDAALFLIGDPKQAIYAFRGADVFTYLHAKRAAAEQTYTMIVNRRSSPRMVQAVNTLFGRVPDPFVLADIPFVAMQPGAQVRDELAGAALHILLMPRAGREEKPKGKKKSNNQGAYINKGTAEKELPAAIAGEVVRLLQSGAAIDGRPLSPADVAVLCRMNRQAMEVQSALRTLGVPCVLQGDASVFDAPEAAELELVLRAVVDPGDAGALKAALVTDMLGVTGGELFALQDDERAWDQWLRRMQGWHQVWFERGFTPSLRRLLDEQDVPARLLALTGGERQLTNLLHLGELLQRAAVELRRGPRGLVEWLGTMRRDAKARAEAVGESAQIRLESDARALKLVTIHKSKGLEYPVVFCPYLWDGALLKGPDKDYVRFHDAADGDRPTIDLAGKDSRHCAQSEREALAENLRLLYVALTRAKYRCVVVWGAVRYAQDSPLGYVLQWPGAQVSDDEMRAQLAELAAASGGSIATADLSFEPPDPYRPPAGAVADLCAREALRVLRMDWRLSSFSRLISGHDAGAAPADEGLDHDEEIGEGLARPPEAAGSAIVLSDFPRGARAGNLIHELFEGLDFPNVAPAALRESAAAALIRYGLDPVWAEPLQRALGDVLDTPLHDAERSLRLREVETARRLNEMEFIFPVAAAGPDARFTSAGLATAFERHGAALPADYPDSIRRLGFAPLAGYLRGFVDLVFEHGGRWYLVDYKSNFLGATAADYRPERLRDAMAQHHYFLQYHLYVVALHQHLALRLPDYDYARDFGGVFYLFVRGMAPGHAPGCGVFFDRPTRALIEALSAALAGVA